MKTALGVLTIIVMLTDWYIAARIRSKYGRNSYKYLSYEFPSCLFDIGITMLWIIWGSLPTAANVVLWVLVVVWMFGVGMVVSKLEEMDPS